jgi:transcriptional regulator with XRE-family HTH domain
MEPQDPAALLRSVGRRIAEVRRERGWTQDDLSLKAGVSVGYVRRLEAGSENLTLVSLVGLANVLEVPALELLHPPSSNEVRRGRPRTPQS